MKKLFSYYTLRLPVLIVYMLQQVEYNPHKFLRWIIRFPDMTRVMRRQELVWTMKARALVVITGSLLAFYYLMAVWYLLFIPIFGVITFLLTPYLVIALTYLIIVAGWLYYEEPRRNYLIKRGKRIFVEHKGIKIAISGSYGKTSMKEILNTVLSEGKKVAATPGNRNVPISHAGWAKQLNGDEEVLLIEYGEAEPGDIKKLASLSQPDYGIITGLAPNHLDGYKTLERVAKDLLSLKDYVSSEKIYVNRDSRPLMNFDIKEFSKYSSEKVLGWKIDKVKLGLEGTSFQMKKGSKVLSLKSGLLGEHQIGPLALAAALADKLGLNKSQIERGIANTVAYEHRMQARQQHGAWIIDDTYNGSLEGMRAGLKLLKELSAKRKIYVTPGLVDQGEETEAVHLELGQLIAAAEPERVVLMQNSVTHYILRGLEAGRYKGELQIEADPLAYYSNLEHVIAAGDLVLMQNDWTDNYA